VALNTNAQVDRWPVTGLPIVPSTHFYFGTPADHFKINCGGAPVDNFDADGYFAGGKAGGPKNDLIDTSATNAGPAAIYQTERWDDSGYTFPMKPLSAGRAYTMRLHFAETTFNAAGKRAFNVVLNGKQVLSDFDVFQESGGKDKVLVKEFSGITPDEKGNIVIKFQTGSADKPKINAIEILN
jgi:hypothetical protein